MINELIKKNIKKPEWILQKSYLWGRSYLKLNKDDVILAFYPKTGSTWVRIFLFNLLSEKSSNEDFTFDQINNIMPNFGAKNFLNEWPFKDTPRFIKTHRNYFNFLYKKNKKILFARHPKDVMISFYHYASAKKQLNFNGEVKDLIYHPLMGLENYMKFYSSWLPHADLVIRYEELRKNPFQEFNKLVDYLNLDFSKEQIEMALEASSIKKTRTAQKQSESFNKDKFSEEFVFARKGMIGDGHDIFDQSPELSNYYSKMVEKYKFDLYD